MAPLVRVVVGELSDEELAALTTVLMARAVAGRPAAGPTVSRARWRRREPGYRSPASWR